ncbi:MAG: Trk system potassium transporter TrkA [Eubacteriales bacterium]|nr:Trk system potassium transporter TrkA [Eubacteriales bacterium]
MNIIVVGCGKIGRAVISALVNEGHDVVAIDKNQEKVEEVTNQIDIMGVCGSGTDCDTLLDAGAGKADVFLATTASDELNMLSCFIAKNLGAKNTVARIRDRAYSENNLNFLSQQLKLRMSFNPEKLAAHDIYNVLKLPTVAHIETFSTRRFEIVELVLREDSPLAGVRIMDLRKKYHANFLICAVLRGEEVIIPGGDFGLESGDRIAITAAPTEIIKLLRHLKLAKKQAKNVMILGASRTAYYLTKLLLASGSNVTVIDKDPDVCNKFSEALPGANVILGDGAQQEILHEEGLNTVDAFISLTGIDEENILLSYYAQSQEVPKVITKVNRDEFISLANRLGLDTIISPRRAISDLMLRYTRATENTVGSNIETLYKIMEEHAEALKFKVSPDFKYLNVPLKDINFKKNILIAGILRNRKAMVPTGDDVFMEGDKAIVISAGHKLRDLQDIIA